MTPILDAVSGAWSPWVSGALLGLMAPALYVLAGRRFGVSSSLRHIGAICTPNAKNEYLRTHDWRQHKWNLVFIGGLMVGAFIASRALTSVPLEILPSSADAPGGLARLVLGGAFVGFGARYAGGCTSGHTISGIANLNWPSVVASAAFFAGGLTVTWSLQFLLL